MRAAHVVTATDRPGVGRESAAALSGGFVGAISGQEFRSGPFSAALNLWTSFGGISANPVFQYGGSLALFAELDLEVGLGYTPVMGVRIAWGS